MEVIPFAATALILTVFVTGCKPAVEDPQRTTADQIEKTRQEAKQVARDLQNYTFAQKSEFAAKMQVQLDELKADIARLSARVEKSSDAAKAEARPKLEALQEQVARLGKQLDDVKDSTYSTWEDIKAASRKGYTELKENFQLARQWASEKIAP